MGLVIDNVTILSNNARNTVYHNSAIVIEDNIIKEICTHSGLKSKYRQFSHMDGQGRLLMPGWINTHMHLYSTFARGMHLAQPPSNFLEILERLWWRLDKALDEQAIYYSAIIPAISAVKHGVTAFIDHHASPNAIDGSLDIISDALEKIGLRAVLCYEVSDRDGLDKARAGLAENERFIRRCQIEDERLFSGMIGLHASFTLSDNTLDHAGALGRTLGKGFHLHLAEGKDDDARLRYGISTTERLNQHGILGNQTLAAHAIHISQKDMNRLAETQTMVVHNPLSNMNNAVGRADIFSMLNSGIVTGLGTDGMSPFLSGDIKAAAFIHKHDLKNPRVGWQEIAQMVLKNNPKLFRRLSGQSLGVIEPGAVADVILVDYFPPTPLTSENLWGHMLYGIIDSPVHTTIIDGKAVMEDGVISGIDEAHIAAKARIAAQKVWQKIEENNI